MGKKWNRECWRWPGSQTVAGYPLVHANKAKKRFYVHRWMWEQANQKAIPDGVEVMHTCDTPSCVNPAHLVLGSHSENMHDMWNKGRNGVGRQATAEERKRILQSTKTAIQLAAELGLGRNQIGAIRRLGGYKIEHRGRRKR